MSGMGFLAVGVGAALGAWLRWLFAVLWNAIHPALPYGTLAANLLGGYLVGVAVGYFDTHTNLPPEWRLLAVTGFLGGLTTFSTFSSEVVANILAGPLVELSEPFAAAVRPGGHALLSGLLAEQADMVLSAYEPRGFVLERSIDRETGGADWRTLLLRKG